MLPFLGGSYVTISGPAAGLAPALFAAMLLLGRGDREVGYPLLLGAICLTGLVQVVLARLKLARFAAVFPAAVVEGMLAAIGLLIIAKQLPLILGTKFEEHEFWGIVRETPSQFMQMDPKVFGLGIFCLAVIFAMASIKARWIKVVPPQVFAAVVGLILGWFMGLDGDRLINIPAEPFKHGIVMPNFQGLFTNHSLWWALFTTVLTLTLIDGVESLATIAAIDKIDPFRRKSDPNKTLNAMGISNMCSSMAGGLTIIPGGVKSTTAILAGARTQWANFYNACFLIIYLLLGRNLINMMPYAALGAIVLYTGLQAVRTQGVEARRAHRQRATLRVHDHGVGHGLDRPALGHCRGHRGQADPRNGDGGASRARPAGGPRAAGPGRQALAGRDRRTVSRPRRQERDRRATATTCISAGRWFASTRSICTGSCP